MSCEVCPPTTKIFPSSEWQDVNRCTPYDNILTDKDVHDKWVIWTKDFRSKHQTSLPIDLYGSQPCPG